VFIYKAILGACRILHSILGLKVISLSLSRSLSLYIYIYGILHTRYIYDTSRAEDATLQHVSLGCCQREDARGCILCSTCVVGLLSNRGCTVGLQCKHRTCNVGLHMQRCVASSAYVQRCNASTAHATLPSVLGVKIQAQHGTACTAQQAACIKSIKSMHQEHVPRPHVTPCVYLYICTCIRRVMPRPVGRLLIHTHTHTHTYTHTCNILVYAVCNLYIYIVYICICMCVCI